MKHRLVDAVGYFLTALCIAGVGVRVVAALLKGKPEIGANVYGLTIGTYEAATVLIVLMIALVIAGTFRVRSALKRRTEK
jgi:hypothetical protein